MAPITQTYSDDEQDESLALPAFHLRCLDLSHPGCTLFFRHPDPAHTLLRRAATQVLRSLYPASLRSSSAVAPRPVRSVTLHLHAFDGVAFTCGSDLDDEHKELHLSTTYLEGIADPDRVNDEIEGVLTHELVHAFQYDGKGTVPGGVIEGIADWVRGQAGLAPPHWREEPGENDRWDAGYERTGFFLAFLSRHFNNPLFVPQLNAALRQSTWDEGKHLRALCDGHDPEALWQTYRRSVEKGKGGVDDQEAAGEPPAPVPTHAASVGGRG